MIHSDSIPVASRAVVLGASNVSRTMGTLVDRLRRRCGVGGDFLLAAGHGRSYGLWSSVLGRSLPAIVDCTLWSRLQAADARPTFALVTDIGNDLLYEQPPERIAGWVAQCLDRLSAAGARTVLTELPLANLAGLSPARFRFFRTLFAPGCGLSLAELSHRAERLNESLLRMGRERGLSVVAPRRQWYGLDPIHIRLGRAGDAWGEIVAGLPAAGAVNPSTAAPRLTLWRCWYLKTRLPARRRIVGVEQRRPQPAARLPDGTTIAYF